MRKSMFLLLGIGIFAAFTLISCGNNSTSPEYTTVTISDIKEFKSLYINSLNGINSEHESELLNSLLKKIFFSREYDKSIDEQVVNDIKAFKRKHQIKSLQDIQTLDFDSDGFRELVAILNKLADLDNNDSFNASTQGTARFLVYGNVKPNVSGGYLSARYLASTSCVWWYIPRSATIKPTSSGSYSYNKLIGASWLCQPQVKDFTLQWVYNYDGSIFSTGKFKIFSYQKGGYKKYKHNINLIQYQPNGIIPLGQSFLPTKDAGILFTRVSGKEVRKNTYDLDIPVKLEVLVIHTSYIGNLYCKVNWGDGTSSKVSCNNYKDIENVYINHKYKKPGTYNISILLSDGKRVSPIIQKKLTVVDNFDVKFNYNGDDSIYGNSWSFDYVISDEISEEPYQCAFSYYFVDPPSNTLLKNFGPVPCAASGRSPVIRLYKDGMHYSQSMILAVDMVVSNANNAVVKKRLTTSVLPPIRVYIHNFSLSPNKLTGGGTVTINYDGRKTDYPYGARANCELWVDGHLTDKLFPCKGSITKSFTNPRDYTISYDVTFIINAQVDYGNGDIVKSEATKTLTLLVDPSPADVTGKCFIQSRAGGPYDRQISCSINPHGEMSPGTYTFTASSAYVCPSLTRYVHAGDNTITFNCHR